MITKFHNLLVIALVIIRRTHKAHRTDRGVENPTGPKLLDFALLETQSSCSLSKVEPIPIGESFIFLDKVMPLF